MINEFWFYIIIQVIPVSANEKAINLQSDINREASLSQEKINDYDDEANAAAKTVDYHCAWDQGKELWMIYLMRVVDAQLVLNKPGSVVLWTNCHHPYYDENPFPETAPADRPVWVGDLWPLFYAGHLVEIQNLKAILEHRHANNIAIGPHVPGVEARQGLEKVA